MSSSSEFSILRLLSSSYNLRTSTITFKNLDNNGNIIYTRESDYRADAKMEVASTAPTWTYGLALDNPSNKIYFIYSIIGLMSFSSNENYSINSIEYITNIFILSLPIP